MKPLSKDLRKWAEFIAGNDEVHSGIVQALLADGAFWREAVKNARGVHCPFCRPEVTVDAFWRDKKSGPIGHAADCPWLLAQGE